MNGCVNSIISYLTVGCLVAVRTLLHECAITFIINVFEIATFLRDYIVARFITMRERERGSGE
jgi:hypothetical protein